MQQNAPTNLYVEKAILNLNKIRSSISIKSVRTNQTCYLHYAQAADFAFGAKNAENDNRLATGSFIRLRDHASHLESKMTVGWGFR